MGSITKASVLLLLLLAFIFIASASDDEMVGAAEEMADIEAEEMMLGANSCYWKNTAFGVCIISENCKKDCVKKGYKQGGKCKGLNRNCYCITTCITMVE